MIPMHGYIDSHPFQKNQMPFGSYRYPSMESDPSYMMMDPTKSCMPLHDSGRNCWHHGYPMPSYSCCNGGNFIPGYYNFRPPHLHAPTQQHMHCYGGYPPYSYMPNWFHPYYNHELPRYEFEKNMMRNHLCCGCPNRLCGQNHKEDSCLKIEEEKPNNQRSGLSVPYQLGNNQSPIVWIPQIEEEKPDNQRSGSVIPLQLGNNRSPIVWIPPDYIESQKEREPSETRTVRQDKECHDLNSTENLKAVEKAPKFWSGWPLSDMSRLGSRLPDAEWMRAQSGQTKQQEDGRKEFPFPFVWMPPFGGLEGARTGVQNMDSPTNYTEEPSNVGKLVPTNILQKDDATRECPEVVKTVNQTNIPQMDVNHKIEDANKKKERRCIKVEAVKDIKERESSKNDVKEQSSTSRKKSRLPPVCLRVDPLPKKKTGNGSSRSQGSPKSTAVKESSQLDSKTNCAIMEPNSEKTIDAVEVEPNSEKTIKAVEVEPNSEKTIEAVEVRAHESLDGNQGDEEYISKPGEQLSSPKMSQEKVSDKFCKEEMEEIASIEHREKDGTISQSIEKDVDEGSKVRSRNLVQEEGKSGKPDLSDVEAALLIQSAYRGYEVRKWELLKKMKQLAEVRSQIIEVQNRVRALELALQDEKEKVFVGEMIMRQLLKLDAIQGLHPSAREFRKSLATELVALQEKLDSIVSKPTEVVLVKHVDVEPHDDLKEEEHNKDDVAVINGANRIDDVNEGENGSNSRLKESNGAQPLCRIANVAGFEGLMSSTDEKLQKPTGDGNSESPKVNDENTKVYEAEQLIEATEPETRNEDALQKVGEVLQMDKQEETVSHQAYSLENFHRAEDSLGVVSDDQVGMQAELTTPQVLEKITTSAPDVNGQIEDQLAEDNELLSKEDNISNNSEADKFEQIDKRDVSEAEENADDLEIERNGDGTLNEKPPEGQEEVHALSVVSEQNEECSSHRKSENGKELASEESAELLVDQSNSNNNIQNNEQQTADEVEKVLEDMQHQHMPSSELHSQVRRAYDESAELLEELSEPLVENEAKTVKDEQQSAGDDILEEACVVDPMPSSSKLEHEASKSYAAEEATSDGTSAVMGEESLPALPNASRETMCKPKLGNEEEMHTKLIEENEKMREMVEKLMEAGKEQIAIISKLSGRVKDLEKRMAKKKKSRRGCGLPTSRLLMLDGRMKP